MKPADATLLLVLGLIWGSAFAMNDVVVEEVGPFTIVAGRLLLAAVLLAGGAVLFRAGAPPRSAWGVLLVLGVIGAGIVLPLYMGRHSVRYSAASASILVLFGGLMLRMVTLLASEQVHVAGAQVLR